MRYIIVGLILITVGSVIYAASLAMSGILCLFGCLIGLAIVSIGGSVLMNGILRR